MVLGGGIPNPWSKVVGPSVRGLALRPLHFSSVKQGAPAVAPVQWNSALVELRPDGALSCGARSWWSPVLLELSPGGAHFFVGFSPDGPPLQSWAELGRWCAARPPPQALGTIWQIEPMLRMRSSRRQYGNYDVSNTFQLGGANRWDYTWGIKDVSLANDNALK